MRCDDLVLGLKTGDPALLGLANINTCIIDLCIVCVHADLS
jgi:hypothetical protein